MDRACPGVTTPWPHSSRVRAQCLRNSAVLQLRPCSIAFRLPTRQAQLYLEVWLPTGCCKGSSRPHSAPAAKPSLPRVWNLHYHDFFNQDV